MLVAGEASDERTKEQHVQTRRVVRETLVDRRQSLTDAQTDAHIIPLQSPAGSSVLSARAPLTGGQTARTSLLASVQPRRLNPNQAQKGEGSHGSSLEEGENSDSSRLAWAYYEVRSLLRA